MASARGKLPPDICDKINFYLLRATDATPLYNQNKLGIYSKLDPVAFYTSLNPLRLKNSGDTKLKKNGSIKTIQSLKSTELNQFIFIDRPNEIFPKLKYSQKQLDVIANAYRDNAEQVSHSMTMKALEADILTRDLKLVQRDQD